MSTAWHLFLRMLSSWMLNPKKKFQRKIEFNSCRLGKTSIFFFEPKMYLLRVKNIRLTCLTFLMMFKQSLHLVNVRERPKSSLNTEDINCDLKHKVRLISQGLNTLHFILPPCVGPHLQSDARMFFQYGPSLSGG